jgi:hypothetical protein
MHSLQIVLRNLTSFSLVADQVRLSVKNHDGNAWLFQVLEPKSHPKKFHSDVIEGKMLCERTPVRMDLSHCGWSDIFFLGMDFPEGARVLNASVDLAVRGRHEFPVPVRSYNVETTRRNDYFCTAQITSYLSFSVCSRLKLTCKSYRNQC